MRIITNADDFGMDEDTTRATIECLDAGALTSATIMANMPATMLAAAYAKAHPEKSFGVHLTYVTDTVEAPLEPAATLKTLTRPDGRFLESNTLRLNALKNRVDEDEIARESSAQIQRLLDMGVRLSHVDSHGHLHKFKPFRNALARVLPKFGISFVRNVQNIYLVKPLKSPTFWFGPWWRKRLMAQFRTTHSFYMPASGTVDMSWTEKLLPRVAADTLEVGVHPGYAESWRDAERKAIHAFADEARRAGHQLIGWKDL